MKQFWLKVTEHWENLSLKEQRWLTVGGLLTSLLLIYATIWWPYYNAVITLREKIVQDETLLQWMQMTDQTIQQHIKQNQPQSIAPDKLLSLTQKQIAKANLSRGLTTLKQSNQGIEIQFAKVNFDKVMQMLIEFSREHKINVNQFNATSQGSEGQVNVDMVIGG